MQPICEVLGAVALNSAFHGTRLDIAPGTAVRFEPGQRRNVQLIPFSGLRRVIGFNQHIMGAL